MKKFEWDLKSVITLMLVSSLCLIALLVTIATIFNSEVLEEFKIVITVFSNAVTGAVTYFYTKHLSEKSKQ